MLSEKPWRPEVVLLLASGLLFSLMLGTLSGMLLAHYLPETTGNNRKFLNFLLSTLSFQGVALVLIHVFLQQHQMSWSEFMGFKAPRLGRIVVWAFVVAVLAVPATLIVNNLSSALISLFHVTPEEQAPVKVLRGSVNPAQRVCFAIAAVLVAPVVEEVLFRGILYPLIKQRGYPKLALWGTSLLFAVIHMNLMTFLPLTLLAFILVGLYEITDNLLAPILTHCFFNAANFLMLVYDTDLTSWLRQLLERI